ncbi:hypothetical protein Asi02nite_42420 [Asanoa siamensis]|uniref:Uncharacterized protein n=1 Tax=Asanoa siamensis TaxID=926357 RepID=A0ABQ4CTX5_9ACTN|nr:hypothetical protein Asi02nite_42420 [Asanoa siamensis]
MEIIQLRIVESAVFEEQVIDLGRATVFVGNHGTGKTLLLRLVQAVFGYTVHAPPFVGNRKYSDPAERPLTGIVEVTVRSDSKLLKRTVDLGLLEEERWEIWNDTIASDVWPQFVSSVQLAADFAYYYQELRLPPRTEEKRAYSAAELSALRNILGRSYDAATVYSVPLDTDPEAADDFYPRPYFEGVISSQTVGSETLSLGETWVHRVFWEIDRLSPGCVILLDEPESFLAVRGQRPFADEVARQVLSRNLQLLIATHSSEVLSRFIPSQIRICMRGPTGKLRVVTPQSMEQVYSAIRIAPPLKYLILVEDDFAAVILKIILAEVGGFLSTVEVLPVHGKDNVIAACRILSPSKRVTFFGVLDADQRTTVEPTGNLSFLPGSHDPERELLLFVAGHVAEIATLLGRSEDEIAAALENCLFLEHQYQFVGMAAALTMDSHYLASTLAKAWLGDPQIRAQAARLCNDLPEL